MDEQQASIGNQPLRGEEQGSPASSLGDKRDAYWDNVKGVCVLLVLCCHTLMFGSFLPAMKKAMQHPGKQPEQPDGGNFSAFEDIFEEIGSPSMLAGLTGALFTLSVVVMPGFSFVSGLLSSEDIAVPRRKKQLLQMGVTCVVNQFASAAMMTQHLPFKFYGGLGVQWFLVCLLFWRLTLPFWMMLRWPLTVSVVVGVLANFTDTTNMYFHSFLCFLPFFIAGQLTRRAGGKEALKRYRRPSWCIGFFAVVLLATALLPLAAPREWKSDGAASFEVLMAALTSTYNCLMYETEACQTFFSIPLRLTYYLFAVPMIPAFLGVIPERHVWGLTRAGQFSMYIYLLHMWLLMPWMFLAQYFHAGLYILGAALYAFAIWALLGTGCARPCCKWCIEPKVDWFIDPAVAATWQKHVEVEPGSATQTAVAEQA